MDIYSREYRDYKKDLEDIYHTWFAYLLYCDEFNEYISMSFHNNIQDKDIPERLKSISVYSGNWLYQLMPEIWTRFPSMDDFDKIWRRTGRIIDGFHKKNLLKENVLEEISGDVSRRLSYLLEDFMAEKISKDDVIASVSGSIIDREFVIQVSDPNRYPKQKIEDDFKDFMNGYPDIKYPPLGEGGCKVDPVASTVGIAPAYRYLESGLRRGELESLKKYLTWYVLRVHHEISAESIYRGDFDESDLPFCGEGVVFTGHKFERTVAKNMGSPSSATSHKRTKSAINEKAKIKAFSLWLNDQIKEAKKVLMAVSQGWFPKIPQESFLKK